MTAPPNNANLYIMASNNPTFCIFLGAPLPA